MGETNFTYRNCSSSPFNYSLIQIFTEVAFALLLTRDVNQLQNYYNS